MLRSWSCLALLVAVTASSASAAEVVTHPAQSDTAISRSSLRGMFGMRLRTWPDGTPVRVFVLDDAAPVHQEFCESVLQMFPYQLRQNWDRLLYSGTGQPPIVVASEDEMLKRIADTPGAIGYVKQFKPAPKSTKKPKGSVNDPVKVIHVR